MSDDPTPQQAPIDEDLSRKRDKAQVSEELLEEKGIFMQAVRSLRRTWFGELMLTKDERDILRHTMRLQALEAIPGELMRYINDYKMALHNKQKSK